MNYLQRFRSKPEKAPQPHKKLSKYLQSLAIQTTNNHRSSILSILSLLDGNLTGTWACHHCKTKNNVIVLPGKHPLGILSCGKCAHVWCDNCTNSKILQRWNVGGSHTYYEGERWNFPYAFMCKHCGLTSRAKIEREVEMEVGRRVHWGWPRKCACGVKPSLEGWTCLRIEGGLSEKLGVGQLLGLLKEKLGGMQFMG